MTHGVSRQGLVRVSLWELGPFRFYLTDFLQASRLLVDHVSLKGDYGEEANKEEGSG